MDWFYGAVSVGILGISFISPPAESEWRTAAGDTPFGELCCGAVYPPTASTSSSVGNRPVCFFEKASRPSTVISNTPPTPGTNSTSAPYFWTSLSLARRARGS